MATPRKSKPLPRDAADKAIFSYPRMIADALRRYAVHPRGPLDPRTVAALDFDTLEKLPAEWITDDFRRRIGDQAWRVRFRWAEDWSAPGGHLLILVEFQSQPHQDMALRMASYAQRVYDELEATGVLQRGMPRPPIFPLVIYSGPGTWNIATTLDSFIAAPKPPPTAVARPEDIEDARRAARDLAAFQLRHAYFALDFGLHREDDPVPDNAVSVHIGLDSASDRDRVVRLLNLLPGLVEPRLMQTMLQWTLLRLGMDQDIAEEIMGMADYYSQLEETAKGWTKQWFAEGRAEGVEQGIEQGRIEGRTEGERAVLRRQAERRFGTSASPLYPLLEQVHSTAKLEEIGEWLVADTIDQLIAKVEAALADDRIH